MPKLPDGYQGGSGREANFETQGWKGHRSYINDWMENARADELKNIGDPMDIGEDY